jgi:hypothetical protein
MSSADARCSSVTSSSTRCVADSRHCHARHRPSPRVIAFERSGHQRSGLLPPSRDRTQRQPERSGNTGLIRSEVPGHSENLAVLIRQAFDSTVKRLPAFERRSIIDSGFVFDRINRKDPIARGAVHDVRPVVARVTHWPGMFSGKVEQLPLDLRCHQSHEATRRIGHCVGERSVQSYRCALGNVVRVVPASNRSKTTEKSAGKLPESPVADFQEHFARRVIPAAKLLEAAGDYGVEVVLITVARKHNRGVPGTGGWAS